MPSTAQRSAKPAPRARLAAATAAVITAASLATACTSTSTNTSQPPAPAGKGTSTSTSTATGAGTATGIGKIRHVVIIMQENRSFDSFFGTYPGADGLPARNGQFTVCIPDPRAKRCDKPYHDPDLVNGGASHSRAAQQADVNGGKMNGFVASAENLQNRGCGATRPVTPQCLPSGPPDVMGYHDAREIPNYWAYAHDFVLQDHMFEPVESWSLPAHLYLVSGWSADCTSTNPASCTNDPAQNAAHLKGQLRKLLRNVPSAFRTCLAAHGVTQVTRANATSQKVIDAGEACLSYLTPAQRNELAQLLGGSGEAAQLATYSWTDLT
jgi:phospholipase C